LQSKVGYVGSCESFDQYGNILYKYAYKEGKLQGKMEKYFPTGQLELFKYCRDGDMNGYFVSYYPHGQIE
jgi:antitoxin component YwqK of YwqJK toxin-antitoxin module